MKIGLLVLSTTLLLANSAYEKQATDENKKAMENKKIKCRTICDKKIYKEQKISEAVNFYKNSKDYKFTKSGF